MVQKNTCLHKKRSTRFLWQSPFVLFEKRRSLNEYFAIYGVNNWAMSTYESRRNLMSNYVRPLIGDMQLSALNTRVMDQFYRSLQKVKPVVVNNVQPKNPVVNATLPKEEHVPRNIWTADTLFKALDVSDDDMLRLALNLAFSCSLRMGEMLALTWDCVDIAPESIEAGLCQYTYAVGPEGAEDQNQRPQGLSSENGRRNAGEEEK